MTVQSKLIEIVRMLEQELQDLRLENQSLSKRAQYAEEQLKKNKTDTTVTGLLPEGWTYYVDQPNYEPVTVGSSCANCGINLDGEMNVNIK